MQSQWPYNAALLFLLPPSCIVVPIRNIVNKLFLSSTFSSSTMSNSQALALPTMFTSNHMGMDIPTGQVSANDFEVRERTPTTVINLSRESSMASSNQMTPYHDRMDNRIDCDSTLGDKTSELSYETEQEKTSCFSKANETTGNTRPQDESNETSLSNPKHVFNMNQNKKFPCVKAPQGDNNNVINIQLPYNPNSPTEPDLWSGNFHPISLYSSIKQIASDTKSIKDSLNFIARYITNKKVNSSKANELSDFEGIGDSI